MSVNEEIGI